MLSKLLDEAINEIDFSQFELESMLEANPALIEMLGEGWIIDEALEHLAGMRQLVELKAKPDRPTASKGKSKGFGTKSGNPGNNPWSDYGASGPKGGAGTGGTTMHDVLGKGGRKKTGEWDCKCSNYECDCLSNKTSYMKSFKIDKARHLAYNRKYKANAHPRKEHPRSV
jgi:hypothetical protein